MPEFIFSTQELGKVTPNGKVLLENVSLSFLPGAKIGVIGVNGSGKTTLMRILAGEDPDHTGELQTAKGITVGYLHQEPRLDPDKNVRQNIEEGVAETRKLLTDFDEISNKLAEPMSDDEMMALLDKQGTLQDKIDAVDAWNLDHTVEVAMDALRVPPDDADVSTLSGGELRRVALCRLLLSAPDALLLDEPTNHLDAESVAWLEHFLEQYRGMVIAVTHDRYFLDHVAGWILELDRGRAFPYKGNYGIWLAKKHARMELEARKDDRRARLLQAELDWINSNQKAKQSKGKARINRYQDMLAEQAHLRKAADGTIYIPPGPRLGDIVVEAKNLKKAYDDKLLFEELSFEIPSGAIVGVVGANGAGKTTLMRILMGQEEPDEGSVRWGETAKPSYVDQKRDALDPKSTVWQEISEENALLKLGNVDVNSRAYCAWFGFKGSDQQKQVGNLSGGERNRVHLAKLVKSGGNLLILDEPTNDLDVETLRKLEDGLLNFAGSAIVISHDRYFLDRICSHILAFEGDSRAIWHEGNYESYEADKVKRLGEQSLPHRIRYRKLKA